MTKLFRPGSRERLSRREVLQGAAAVGVAAATAAWPGARQAALAASPVVRGYGVTTSQLKDWSIMEKANGIQMEFTGTNADIGVFMRDVISNDLGETHDIFIFDGGTEDVLGPQGYYGEVIEDHPELTLWERTPDAWKRTDLLQAEGKQYGVPVIGNADSFGYFPEAIGANPNGLDEISWAKMYEDEGTKGRVSLDRSWLLSMPEVAQFLKHHGRVEIEDVANMTGDEARQVADYAAERKRAGQFRTLHAAFEEQVQLLSNREIDLINCWEPATKESNLMLGPNTVIYAFTEEGYYKWGHGAYVHVKALERDNVDNIYKVLNYYLERRVSRLSGPATRLCRPQHGPRRAICAGERLAAGRRREPEVDRHQGHQEVREALLRQARGAQLGRHGRGVATLPKRLI